jgi:flagella basal body P-ring formation protein FlgA
MRKIAAAPAALFWLWLAAGPLPAFAEAVLPPGQPLDQATVEALIGEALAARGVAGPLSLRVDRPALPLPNQATRPIALTVAALDHEPRSGRYRARLAAKLPDGASSTIEVAGLAEELVEVPVLGRPLAEGQTIAAEDLIRRPLPASALRADSLLSAAELVGQAAARPLAAGRPLRSRDIAVPQLIRRGDVVKIVYATGGLEIVTAGIALEPGPRGAMIQVQNAASGETRRGTVSGLRRVVVDTGAAP